MGLVYLVPPAALGVNHLAVNQKMPLCQTEVLRYEPVSIEKRGYVRPFFQQKCFKNTLLSAKNGSKPVFLGSHNYQLSFGAKTFFFNFWPIFEPFLPFLGQKWPKTGQKWLFWGIFLLFLGPSTHITASCTSEHSVLMFTHASGVLGTAYGPCCEAFTCEPKNDPLSSTRVTQASPIRPSPVRAC